MKVYGKRVTVDQRIAIPFSENSLLKNETKGDIQQANASFRREHIRGRDPGDVDWVCPSDL
jgi:hypothetical protein